MKKTTLLFSLLLCSLLIIAQPIKVRPVKYFFEGYSPTLPCPECPTLQKPTIKSTTKPHKVVVPTKSVLPIINKDTVVFTNIVNVYNDNGMEQSTPQSISTNTLPSDKEYISFDDFYDVIHVQKYKSRGTYKILTGLGFQAVGVGIIAYANIPTYCNKQVIFTHDIPYTYETYELIPIINPYPKSDNSKCTPPTQTQTQTVIINNTIIEYNPVTYTLVTHTKAGLLKVNDISYVAVKKVHDKTAYYISAGVLGVTGLIFEISGLCDLKKAHIYATYGGVGMRFSF